MVVVVFFVEDFFADDDDDVVFCDCCFDVARVVVPAADDDEVLRIDFLDGVALEISDFGFDGATDATLVDPPAAVVSTAILAEGFESK